MSMGIGPEAFLGFFLDKYGISYTVGMLLCQFCISCPQLVFDVGLNIVVLYAEDHLCYQFKSEISSMLKTLGFSMYRVTIVENIWLGPISWETISTKIIALCEVSEMCREFSHCERHTKEMQECHGLQVRKLDKMEGKLRDGTRG